MKVKETSLAMRILYGFLALVLIVAVSATTAYGISKNTVKKAQSALKNTIKMDLGEYLAEYQGTYSGESGELTADMPEEVELTEEQIASIVEAVASSIEYDLIKDTISSYATVSEESLRTLEQSMSEKITTVLNSDKRTAGISDVEKESMIKTISSIVKSDMITILGDYGQVSETDMNILQNSLEGDIKTLENMLSVYQSQFAEIERQLASLSKDSVSDKSNFKSDITNLTTNYNNLLSKYETLQKDISKATGDQSAELKKLIAENTDVSQKSIDNINKQLTEMTASTKEAIKSAIETNNESIYTSLSGVQSRLELLQGNVDDNQDAINNELQNAITLFNAQYESLGNTQSAELQQLHSELNSFQSQTYTKDAVTNMINTLNAANIQLQDELNQNTQNIMNNLGSSMSELESKLNRDVNATIANMQTEINNANSALTDSVTSLQDSHNELAEIVGFGSLSDGDTYMVGSYENGVLTITSVGGK